MGVPIFKKETYNINLNFFVAQNFMRMNGANSLFDNETPQTLIYKTAGMCIGIQF
jgi:hypothetical protein